MNEMSERIKYLLDQYANQTASRAEENELFKIIGETEHDNLIKSIMFKMMQTGESSAELNNDRWQTVLNKVLNQQYKTDRGSAGIKRPSSKVEVNTSQKKLYLKKWFAAASILLVFFSGWYYLFSAKNVLPASITKNQPGNDKSEVNIPAGRDQAVLTLDDGSAINLDSVKNGTLTRQGNTKIVKGDKGELLYYVDRQSSDVSGYNTISIPRGGKYEIVLCDGSKVWLNAASSLKYPTSFKGKIRHVTLTGEGYFEVAKNSSMPFQVTINDMTVEVLGTHFNINGYRDEHSVATTLLEGSVKVTTAVSQNAESNTVVLKPGQQADLAKDGRLKISSPENIEQVIAWKENNFEFNNDIIPVIMRQISRWYDVEVDYKGSIPARRLTGKFSRDVTLNQLIEMLRYTGVNMKIENKKIIIRETDTNN